MGYRAKRANNGMSRILLLMALAAILVLGGVMVGCGKGQTTTSSAATSTSAPATTTTSSVTRTTTTGQTSTGPSAADFYKSNVVTIVVPYVPGGGVDYLARLFANYWTETTGGRMVVVNKEGAAGFLGANYVYISKPDGLTLGVGIAGAGLIMPTLAQDPAIKFDIKKMNWIVFTNPEAVVLCPGPKAPYKSMAELTKVKGLKFASSGRSTTTAIGTGILIDFFGLQDAGIVLGYSGTPDSVLAVAKGEVDGYVSSNLRDSYNKGLLGYALVSVDLDRSPAFPDAPTVGELLKLSPNQQSLVATQTALQPAQLTWLPPGVPQDRIDFVRSAFDKIVANANFLKQAMTFWPVWVPPVSGKDYAAQLEKTLTVVTPEKFNALQAVANKYFR